MHQLQGGTSAGVSDLHDSTKANDKKSGKRSRLCSKQIAQDLQAQSASLLLKMKERRPRREEVYKGDRKAGE